MSNLTEHGEDFSQFAFGDFGARLVVLRALWLALGFAVGYFVWGL